MREMNSFDEKIFYAQMLLDKGKSEKEVFSSLVNAGCNESQAKIIISVLLTIEFTEDGKKKEEIISYLIGSGIGRDVGNYAVSKVVPNLDRKEEKDKREIPVFEGMGGEVLKAVHGSKSFTMQAFLTLILYSLGYLPGLIANILYLSATAKSKNISGISPPGRGCLIFLLWVNLIIPIILILIAIGYLRSKFNA